MFKKWCKKHTRIIQKALAFIIAFCILALCVLISFIVPPVKASAASPDYDTYLQALPGVIADGPLSPSDGVQLGLQLGLQQAYETMLETGDFRNAGTIVTLSGKYIHNGEYHLAWWGNSPNISMNDGGGTLAQSDEFELRTTQSYSPSASYFIWSVQQTGASWKCTLNGRTGNSTTSVTFLTVDSSGSSIFPTPFTNTVNLPAQSWTYAGCLFSGVSVPVLNDNSSIDSYCNGTQNYSSPAIAGWQGYSPVRYVSDIPGANDFTFTSDNFLDFILDVYNPWIIENYPDLEVYLYTPSQDPTEETGGGCGCHVEVYVEPTVNVEVNVEPTVNVEVNVENEIELPSEWVETYPFDTLPSENVEFPTESPSYALPTDPIEALPPGAKDGIHFWVALWGSLLVSSGLIVYVPVFLVLSIIEWLLWHAGGSKSGKGGGH